MEVKSVSKMSYNVNNHQYPPCVIWKQCWFGNDKERFQCLISTSKPVKRFQPPPSPKIIGIAISYCIVHMVADEFSTEGWYNFSDIFLLKSLIVKSSVTINGFNRKMLVKCLSTSVNNLRNPLVHSLIGSGMGYRTGNQISKQIWQQWYISDS